MWYIIKLLLIVVMPFVWGIGSDYVFARIQNRKRREEQPTGASK